MEVLIGFVDLGQNIIVVNVAHHAISFLVTDWQDLISDLPWARLVLIVIVMTIVHAFLGLFNHHVRLEVNVASVILRAAVVKEWPEETGHILLLRFHHDVTAGVRKLSIGRCLCNSKFLTASGRVELLSL
jgi:hypothetical protein